MWGDITKLKKSGYIIVHASELFLQNLINKCIIYDKEISSNFLQNLISYHIMGSASFSNNSKYIGLIAINLEMCMRNLMQKRIQIFSRNILFWCSFVTSNLWLLCKQHLVQQSWHTGCFKFNPEIHHNKDDLSLKIFMRQKNNHYCLIPNFDRGGLFSKMAKL